VNWVKKSISIPRSVDVWMRLRVVLSYRVTYMIDTAPRNLFIIIRCVVLGRIQ